MIRHGLFFGTLGAMSAWLVDSGLRAGSMLGHAQLACGIFAGLLTLGLLVEVRRGALDDDACVVVESGA